MKETVQNNVQDFRSKTGDRQQDLAQAVGVTRQTIIAIERGSYVPSVLLSLKIAKHFKVNVEDLFKIDAS